MKSDRDERLLVLMPTAKDRDRTARILASAGVANAICESVSDLLKLIDEGAAAALLTEEQLEVDFEIWESRLQNQPPWSDFPLIVLARDHTLAAQPNYSLNITLVERPVRIRSLISVINTALRSRRRQYEVRDHLAERKESEEMLRSSEKQTAEALQAARRAESELRESDRKKDDFIALLAHELRNPLAPVRTGLRLIQLAGADSEATMKARDMMERQLSHMVRLIDDLLDVSRICRNKMELRRTETLLSEVITTALETAKPWIDASSHTLTIELPKNPVYLDADLTRLAQVFSNLLTNSAKYTPPGGRISISSDVSRDYLSISVTDSGIGIPADCLGNIFDMFSQVDRSMERTSGGLGIGLALVKGLVESHGGTVTASSPGPGRGSTFNVVLPIHHKRRSEITKTYEHSLKVPSRRILVVDDNIDGAESLTLMLKLLGNDVQIANDGLEALDLAEKFRPEVILMDIGMPRLNGYEATKRIRQHGWGKDISIIALTGWGQENDREQSRRAGCNGHLVKPVDLDALQQELGYISGPK